MPLEPGTKLGPYEILAPLGAGGMGEVYLYVKLADGTASEELLIESDLPKIPMSWSPDGKLLVYWVNDPKTRGDVWAVPITGDRKPLAILQTQYEELNPQVSPDGKWIAYSSSETGRLEIYDQHDHRCPELVPNVEAEVAGMSRV